MTQRLMLLDSASLYFRAFYGVPDQRRAPDESPTNAVRGFLDMISTLVVTHRPTHLEAASAYLDVAPMVVQVALDAPVPDFDATLPRQVGDPILLSSLASSYGLTNPINRVLSAFGVGENY